jgi:hypothetical protein
MVCVAGLGFFLRPPREGAQAPRLFGTPGGGSRRGQTLFTFFLSVYQNGQKKFPAAPAIWAILGPPILGPKIKKKKKKKPVQDLQRGLKQRPRTVYAGHLFCAPMFAPYLGLVRSLSRRKKNHPVTTPPRGVGHSRVTPSLM